MGCEAHPNTHDRIFHCSGDLRTVYDPYFVADTDHGGIEYPHWNGAAAFEAGSDTTQTRSLATTETVLTNVPGEIAFTGLQMIRKAS